MAVNGISGTGITGTLSNGSNAIDSAVLQNEAKKFFEWYFVALCCLRPGKQLYRDFS